MKSVAIHREYCLSLLKIVFLWKFSPNFSKNKKKCECVEIKSPPPSLFTPWHYDIVPGLSIWAHVCFCCYCYFLLSLHKTKLPECHFKVAREEWGNCVFHFLWQTIIMNIVNPVKWCIFRCCYRAWLKIKMLNNCLFFISIFFISHTYPRFRKWNWCLILKSFYNNFWNSKGFSLAGF